MPTFALGTNAQGQGMGSIIPSAGITPTAQSQIKPVEPTTISSDMSKKIAEYKQQISGYTQANTQQQQQQQSQQKENITNAKNDIQLVREQNGTYTGVDGNQYYRYDGSPAAASSSESSVDESGLPTGDPLQFTLDQSTKIYNYVKQKTDPQTNALISQIQQQFDVLMNMQKMTNAGEQAAVDTALLRGGSSRYTTSSSGISAAQMSVGAMALADLQNRENDAILKVKSAAEKDAWDTVGKLLTQADNIRQEKIALAQKQNNALSEQVRKANISQAISGLIDMQGPNANPKAILDAMNSNPMLAGLNATSDDVQKAYQDLVGSPAQLGQDWNIYQKLLSTGELSKFTNKPNPGFFDYFHAMDVAKANPTDPNVQRIRELTIQQKMQELQGYVTLPTNPDGSVNEKDVNYASAMKYALADGSMEDIKNRGRIFSEFLRKGDYTRAADFIAKSAIETESAEKKRSIQDTASTLMQLYSFQDLMNEMKQAGVDTNIITGTSEDLHRKAGTTSDPLRADFLERASVILYEYRKSMTGVQFSYGENEDYKKLFPDYKNTLTLNQALLNSLEDGLARKLDTYYEQKLGNDNYQFLVKEKTINKAYGFNQQQSKTPAKIKMDTNPDDALFNPTGSGTGLDANELDY